MKKKPQLPTKSALNWQNCEVSEVEIDFNMKELTDENYIMVF